MTAMPRELARKQPAELVARREPEVIDGEVKHPLTVGRLLLWFLLGTAGFLFAGLLLSMT